MMRDYWVIDHRLAVWEGYPHGRLRRALRCLDSFGGPTAHRIPTPIVYGRGGHAALRRQCPPGRTTLRLGTRHRREGSARASSRGALPGEFRRTRPAAQRSEEKDPQLAADIRAIVEPHTHADPELKSSRRYTNLSAAEVRQALIDKGYPRQGLPSERTMRDILNRMNYRLKRIQKGKPLKKTDQTGAIFANVAAVREQARGQPETLEIAMDTKAKVGLGDYVRGGENPDGLRR